MTENERKLTVAQQTIDLAVPRKLFRLVDGKLVPVPGGRRDLTKLYRVENNGVETYEVELTEAELEDRRQQQLAWKADEPRREAEQKRQEEEVARFRESLMYESRVTAFLDVIGWSDAIDRSVRDPKLTQELGVALNASMLSARLIEHLKVQTGMEKWYGDPQLTQFSDSILLSVPSGDRAEESLVFHLHPIVSSLLRLGFLVRGGIASGELIHKGSVAYGPALLDAYKIEKDVAQFPRIVLSNGLAQEWGVGTKLQDHSGAVVGQIRYWRRDEDGSYFYDFLYPVPGIWLPWDKNALAGSLRFVHSTMAEQIESRHTKEGVMQKRAWFAKYFNNFCDEHGVDAAPRLRIP